MNISELIKQIKFLAWEIETARTYTIQILSIQNARTNEKRLARINLAPSFFGVTFSALWECLYLCLSRALDDRGDSVSIPKIMRVCQSDKDAQVQLARYIDNNKQPKDDFVCIMANEFHTYDQFHDKLKTSRDKILAHNDRKYAGADLLPVSTTDILAFVNWAQSKLNELLLRLDSESVVGGYIECDDLFCLLDS